MVDVCRSCSNPNLKLILSLGNMPLANSLLNDISEINSEDRYPLKLVFCPECSLVQIANIVSPEKLFRDYLYFSSYSDTFLEHVDKLSSRIIQKQKLDKNSMVMEMASNDGYLLKYYKQKSIPVLGIEPAVNIAEIAKTKHGIDTIPEFFNFDLAKSIVKDGKYADVFHAHNVMAHIPNINDTVAGIEAVLKNNGTIVIETPYIIDLINKNEFDTIYHEHIFYYSLTSLNHLLERHNLVITDIEHVSIHGGSLRVFATKKEFGVQNDNVRNLLKEEQNWGINSFDAYCQFAANVENLKKSLKELLLSLKNQGKSIAAYGAAAKGSTLLNYFDIGKDLLDFVVDRSPHKQGKFMPGVHLPIVDTSALLEKKPDYVLILAWNFADEIIQQQQEYRNLGGKFIVPIPEAKVVE